MSARPIYVETWAARRSIRGRLFRKYLILILLPVTIALLASNAISVYFFYREIMSGLAGLQHEKALALASSIEQYIRQIEQQLTYAALPQLDASDVAVRYGEFRNLLRQVPAVTDIVQLDSAGKEQIAVSRSGLENFDSGKVRSEELAFRYAECGEPWAGPVYFQKTEPYMTIAIRSCGDKEPVTGPVTVAVVNLKFILELVSRIKIGDKGMAYVVDGNGFLIPDPDGPLRKIDMSDLPHVKAAIGNQNLNQPAMVSMNLARTMVLTSFARIEPLHWYVFVEQPVSEVYEKLNAPILRTGLLLLAGLVISALAALALAQRIGVGELDQKIDEILATYGNIASAHFYAGRYDEASSWAEKAFREQPNWVPAARIAAASNALVGRLEQAQKAMARLRQLDPALRLSNLRDAIPLRCPADVARLAEGLRKAGLPE